MGRDEGCGLIGSGEVPATSEGATLPGDAPGDALAAACCSGDDLTLAGAGDEGVVGSAEGRRLAGAPDAGAATGSWLAPARSAEGAPSPRDASGDPFDAALQPATTPAAANRAIPITAWR
jgi:hypothetical protein